MYPVHAAAVPSPSSQLASELDGVSPSSGGALTLEGQNMIHSDAQSRAESGLGGEVDIEERFFKG